MRLGDLALVPVSNGPKSGHREREKGNILCFPSHGVHGESIKL
jgi:hypothetical protein